MSELLRCPFCGRQPDTENAPARGTDIYCAHEDCGGARIFVSVDETASHGEEAIHRWNSRSHREAETGVADLVERIGEIVHGRHERGFVMWPLIDGARQKQALSLALASPQRETGGREIVARALWLESASFPEKMAHWDTPGRMLDIDREPYFRLADAALAALQSAPREPEGREAAIRREGAEIGAAALEEIGKMLIEAAAEVRSDKPFDLLKTEGREITEATVYGAFRNGELIPQSLTTDAADLEFEAGGEWNGCSLGAIYVVQLEWDGFGGRSRAKTPFCNYMVFRHLGTWGYYRSGQPGQGSYATEDEAKAAAQNDYETRIKSAIMQAHSGTSAALQSVQERT